MNPADEEAAKLVPTDQRPGAVAGSPDDLEEQLHATLKDLQRTNHQSNHAKDLHGSNDKLDEKLRVSVEALLHPSPPSIPAEEVDDLLLAITHHLDDEALERKKIHNRLRAIENEMGRLTSRGFRYLVALCIGLAAILAWQSYGETAKQIIATRAPELGWSPQTKQMIASWTKQPAVESKAAPVTQTAPEKVAAKQPTTALDPQQIQQIEADIATVRHAVERHLSDVRATVERLAASQDEMARETEKLQATNQEILEKIPTPPPKRPALARKPIPTAPSRSQAPMPPRPLSHP
jgi:chromosome segregation ATPase